ncbi:MAG: hypothetical protein LBG45_04460, partial [Dysgonamonadaceae bacterium]|nr:hypothetical protein [Dysgonamonadaceae bacterium]
MKRKLFTLLLAIGVLTAFQANAQTKVRFLVDSSGLAKTSLKDDSFPRIKKGLHNWLSFSERISLKTGSDTSRVGIEKAILGDPSSIFTVKFFGKDSTQFQIIPKDGVDDKDAIKLDHSKGSTSLFSILKLNSKPDGNVKAGVLANFPKAWTTTEDEDTIAGYLAYVPDPNPNKLKLDTLDGSVGLVGFDKITKEFSIKYFNEFAFYADTLPYMLQSFQYGYDKPGSRRFDPGKLYETDSFPFFQIYDNDKPLLKSSKNWTEEATFNGGTAINWGYRNSQYGHKPNPNDSIVYSWLDIKLDGDAVILPGYKRDGSGDSSAVVRLDTLHHWVDSIRKANNKQYTDRVGFDTTHLHRDLISRWIKSDDSESGDSSHVYLKNDNGRLSFTVKLRDDRKESDWTNGYPTLFDYEDHSVYYRIDTAFHTSLIPIFEKLFGQTTRDSIFSPAKSRVARYVYKNDDRWRPLYVKVNQVKDDEKERKYEYIGAKWLDENKLLDVNITPEVVITGLSSRYISKGEGKISLTDAKDASFKISRADTIQKQGNWFTNEKYGYVNNAKNFENTDSVELFNISDGGRLLLTVSDTRDFEHPLKNSLTWADTLRGDGESVLQMFAIVRDCNDGNYTFLPVAARYEENDTDTLSFNLAIGRGNDGGQLVNLAGAWHLESSLSYKLVVADSISKTEPLKFRLTSPFHPWEGPESDYVVIRNAATKKYYRGYSDGTDTVTANDIAAQWTVKKDGESWQFTPVFKDKGDVAPPFAKTKVNAYSSDESADIYLEWDNNKDTVVIEIGYAPEDFDLYSDFDFDWKNNKGLVTIVSGEKYLAYNNKNEVSYVTGTADDSPAITIHKSEENDVSLISATYPVHYYRFSYNANGKEYYLKAGGEGKISWDATATPEDDHKFYLPKGFDEGKFYLHNHEGHLLQVSKDGSKLSFATEGTVYSTVNDINDATEPATLQWTITKKGELKDTWAVVDPTLFDEDSTATGVLVIGGAGETFIGSDRNGKGVLSGEKNSSVVLKLKAVTPVPQSIVAYSPLKATAETDVKVGYNIIHGDLYLTDEDAATFSEANTSEKQTFAFKNNEEDDGFAIVLFSDENRFLSSAGLNLKFSNTDKLSFTWGKAED